MNREIIIKKIKAVGFFDFTNWVQNNKELTIALIIVFIIFIDISNLDASFHKAFCLSLTILPTSVVCPDFYDIPIWSFFEVAGVIATVVVALWSVNIGLKQANKQEKSAQEIKMDQDMPIIFLNPEPQPKLHKNGEVCLELMNVGKGIAKDVYVYIEDILVEGNFSMLTASPDNLSELKIKFIASDSSPERQKAIAQKIQHFSEKKDLQMKITYSDIHGRSFVTDQIIFEKNQVGDYMHNRGKWSFRKVQS